MMFPLDLLPVLSILLLCLSLWLTIKVMKQGKNNVHRIIIVLNIVFLVSLIGIFVYYISANDLSFIAPSIYWALIAGGILTGMVSFVKRFVPGQMMSAGLLLFTGFVALFSVGIILFALFVIQLIFGILNWKRNGLGVAV